MKKIVTLFLFLFSVAGVFAQERDRVSISGSVIMPEAEDPQGVTVFNINSKKGTVTNETGTFKIAVALNDSLSVSSLQFQAFIIVIDEGIINTRQINIRINEVVNLLPEVVVRPYDLTGNISVDINRLPVANLPDSLDAVNTQGMYFKSDAAPDLASPPENVAMAASQNRLINGLNFVNLFKEFLITSKTQQIERPQSQIYAEVRELYDDEFFRANFDIKLEDIPEFIDFADRNGLKEEMLQEGNELDLIEFLLDQSKRFKKQKGQN